MVSVCRNPVPGQDFYYFNCMDGDPMKMGLTAINNANNNLLLPAASGNAGPGAEDPNKKVRKPYTITKSRESWTDQEHDKFLEALQLFDRDWKKIEAFVGSKTVIQIRSHAQKYFLKVQKNGTSEHVPPPRPKRKAAHPYPQKAPKKVVSQATGPLQSSAALLETGSVVRPDSLSVPGNAINSAALSPWTYSVLPTGNMSHVSRDDMGLGSFSVTHNYSSSSSESTPRLRPSNESNPQVKEKQDKLTKAFRLLNELKDVYLRREEHIGLRQLKDMLLPRICGRTWVWESAIGLPSDKKIDLSPQLARACFRMRLGKRMSLSSDPENVMPDFAEVYSFIGSVFDPNASDHLESLKKMDRINVETALMLMKNLSMNLMSPEFEDHRRMLSSSSVGVKKDRLDSPLKNLQVDKVGNAIPTV